MKTIEAHLFEIYKGIKKDVPGLNALSFMILESVGRNPYLSGFIHTGEICEEFKSVEALKNIVSDKVSSRARNEILYRRYEKEVADEPSL